MAVVGRTQVASRRSAAFSCIVRIADRARAFEGVGCVFVEEEEVSWMRKLASWLVWELREAVVDLAKLLLLLIFTTHFFKLIYLGLLFYIEAR